MADFTPIETQEDLDKIIEARLGKERKKYEGYMSPQEVTEKYKDYMSPDDVAKKYDGYLSPGEVTEKYKGYASPEEIAKKDAEIKAKDLSLTRLRVAHEMGVPDQLADRLSGETEEEIRKDAELVVGLTKPKTAAPLKNTEPKSIEEKDPKRAAYKRFLDGMKGEE